MSIWPHQSNCTYRTVLIQGERFTDGTFDDPDDSPLDIRSVPPDDESERIVEEAIRRLEEAEDEWSRSWEPDKSSE